MILLIVEDNPAVRRLIRRATNDVADTTFECEDGADALTAYMEHRPDVVLMDVRMPRMDGLSATRQLLCYDAHSKIIILTDYDDEELRLAAYEAGACAFALKHNLTELDTILQDVLGRPPSASSVPAD